MNRPVAEFGIYGRKAEAAICPLFGLAKLHNVHVSFVSGNTTMLGIALGHQDWARAGLITGILRLFVSRAAASAVIDNLSGLHVLAMGALNVAINRIGGEAISLYVRHKCARQFRAGSRLGFVRSCTRLEMDGAGADVA